MKVTISSGHSKYVSGAIGILNEVTEARRVTDRVANYLKQLGAGVNVYHDDVSRTQKDNVNNIVRQHNSTIRDLDVSIHFNAKERTDKPVGVEVYYVSAKDLAFKVSVGISKISGLKDRGGKYRGTLGFLNGTNKPAILIEVCFVDSAADAQLYSKYFERICLAIAESITGLKLKNESNAAAAQLPDAKKEGTKLYKPSAQAITNSTRVVLNRLVTKDPNGIDPSWVKKLDEGTLTESDALGLIFVAIERGLIQGTK